MTHLRRDVVVERGKNFMSSDSERMAQGIAIVEEFFDGVFDALKQWIPQLSAELQEAGGKFTGPALTSLVKEGSFAILDTVDRPLYGAGFCGSDAIVTEGNPLAWWQGADRSLLATSTFGPGQAAIDLERLEWFRIPRETGAHHVAGPFVDYLCSNEITITSAEPLFVDGEFWGVACADVLVASIEESLLPSLEGISNASLVNANGRVVLSTDPDCDTGDRLPGIDAESGQVDEAAAGAAFSMVRSNKYPFALVAPRVAPRPVV